MSSAEDAGSSAIPVGYGNEPGMARFAQARGEEYGIFADLPPSGASGTLIPMRQHETAQPETAEYLSGGGLTRKARY